MFQAPTLTQANRDLNEAQAVLHEAEVEVVEAQMALLNMIADKIVSFFDTIGNGIAHRYPQITRQLGFDAVQHLRHDLVTAVAPMQDQVQSSWNQIDWPITHEKNYEHMREARTDLATAIDAFLIALDLGPVQRTFIEAGYEQAAFDVQAEEWHAYGTGVYHDGGDDLNEIVAASVRRDKARSQLAQREETLSRAEIDAIWNGSNDR